MSEWAPWTFEQENARQSLIESVKTWRNAECSRPTWDNDEGLACDGDNHREDCPIEIARQDIIASHNKVEQLHAQ